MGVLGEAFIPSGLMALERHSRSCVLCPRAPEKLRALSNPIRFLGSDKKSKPCKYPVVVAHSSKRWRIGPLSGSERVVASKIVTDHVSRGLQKPAKLFAPHTQWIALQQTSLHLMLECHDSAMGGPSYVHRGWLASCPSKNFTPHICPALACAASGTPQNLFSSWNMAPDLWTLFTSLHPP
jgi:hypothetical protein